MKFEPNKPLELPPVLDALQAKRIYEGTVPPEVVAKRRAKNKAARKARKANKR
jgi:hypothetical protein